MPKINAIFGSNNDIKEKRSSYINKPFNVDFGNKYSNEVKKRYN